MTGPLVPSCACHSRGGRELLTRAGARILQTQLAPWILTCSVIMQDVGGLPGTSVAGARSKEPCPASCKWTSGPTSTPFTWTHCAVPYSICAFRLSFLTCCRISTPAPVAFSACNLPTVHPGTLLALAWRRAVPCLPCWQPRWDAPCHNTKSMHQTLTRIAALVSVLLPLRTVGF